MMRLLLLLVITLALVAVDGRRRRPSHSRRRTTTPQTTTTNAPPPDPETIDGKVQVLWDIFKNYEQKGAFKTENLPNKLSCGPANVHLHVHAEDDQDHEEDDHEAHEHADHHQEGDMSTDHDHKEHHEESKQDNHAHVHLHVQVEPSKTMQKMMMKHKYGKGENKAVYGVCFMIPNAAGTRAGQVIGMLMLKQQMGKDTEMRVMLRGLDVTDAVNHADHTRKLYLHEAGIVALGACEDVGKVVKYGETDMDGGKVASFECDEMGNVVTNLTTESMTLFGDSSAFGRTIVMRENDGSVPSCCVVFRTTSDYWTGKKQFPRRGPQPTF